MRRASAPACCELPDHKGPQAPRIQSAVGTCRPRHLPRVSDFCAHRTDSTATFTSCGQGSGSKLVYLCSRKNTTVVNTKSLKGHLAERHFPIVFSVNGARESSCGQIPGSPAWSDLRRPSGHCRGHGPGHHCHQQLDLSPGASGVTGPTPGRARNLGRERFSHL